MTLDEQGVPVGEWRFYGDRMQLLSFKVMPDYTFDPRTRPWFRDAAQGQGMQLTAPYVFFTTRAIGMTISERPKLGDAVVALDVELSELSAQLGELRPTPGTEIVIARGDGSVVAHSDPDEVLDWRDGKPVFRRLADLREPALAAFASRDVKAGETLPLDIDSETWFGIKIPLSGIKGADLNLYLATPDRDLFQATRDGLARHAVGAAALRLLLMAAGWMGGKRIGRDLTQVTARAQQLSRFDFSRPLKSPSRLSEVQALEVVLDEVCTTIEGFLLTTETIGREADLERMLGKVLRQMVGATGSRFGAVYLLDECGGTLQLNAVAQAASAEPILPDPELPLDCIARPGAVLDDIGPEIVQLAVPLTDRQRRPIGLLILAHPLDLWHSSADFRVFVEKLSGALSAAIEARRMAEAQQQLLEGFIRLIAGAIDAKSPYTGGHCLRVPELATTIIARMAGERDGPYAAYQPTADDLYAFHLGAWLHDCGKVTSPEHVIDKATKLESLYNRIHEVRARFEMLWRDVEIAHLRRLLAGEDEAASQQRLKSEQDRLREDFDFVARCNIGGEYMTDEAISRLNEIGRRTWQRHFSDRLGLSRDEAVRLDAIPEASLPVTEQLLADKPEHRTPWGERRPPVEKGDGANVYGFDMKLPPYALDHGELHNLSIRRGTLTDEERFKINDHIVQTYIMLRSLPWPRALRRVPEIAATHHERMDGKGYPRRLTANEMTLEDRVMAIADVFEALTAADRPYKPAKTLSEALGIMLGMCQGGHLDPELFRYFLQSRLWADYAARFLKEEQRDLDDIGPLLTALPMGAGAEDRHRQVN
ncbi:HD domain-containing phosphohydrolase [Xanthobacter sp. ZOL 2024]